MDNILKDLNEVQQEIVKDTEGQILTLAGAGSGKTRVLTHRIAYLLLNNVKPWQILAVTFTNKAAREMRERLVSLIGEAGRDVWIGTFHGICVRILSRFGQEIGLENGRFTIIDDTEQKKVLKEAMDLCGVEYNPDTISSAISNAKNQLRTPEEMRQTANAPHEKDIANVYIAYEEKKQEYNYLDFDDLIMKTVHLLRVSETARDQYQHQFHYVLADEGQDTNIAQYELLKLLTAEHDNLFIVADVDQSIYKWRGANVQNMMEFNQTFPDMKLYKLEQNYRSTKNIVEASNILIANNTERLEKTAFTELEEGDPIILHKADDDTREADFVSDVIRHTRQVEGRDYNHFAVLYRTNRQSREIEKAFTQHGIPYQVVGGHAFYNRKEIKDITAYLRAVDNSIDALAFERIINTPRRGIGKTTIDRIQDYANDCNIPFPKALENIADIPKIPKKAKVSIEEFLTLMIKLREFEASEEFTVLKLIHMILEETGYREMYQTGKEEDESRLENLDELMNVADIWDHENTEQKKLGDFLSETTLVSDIDGMEEQEAVTLMTIHAAKGLEFHTVFVIGLEEGIFPHGRSLADDKELEEERRLAYVALTRAERRLYLSYCQQRYEYGNPQPVRNHPSRFIRELPRRLIRRI